MKLSAIVITKNEEHNIGRCLDSLAFTDEQIVVDAQSQDKTVEIAQQKGAQTFVRPWPGYGQQKNFAAGQARGEWLLFIDADEEVPPQLAQNIREAIENPSVEFYWLRIVTVFLGKPLYHLYGHNPRLFRQTAGRWTTANVHEQVETVSGVKIRLHDEHSEVIPKALLHHSHPTIASYLKKMEKYTTLDAKQMAKTNTHRSGKPVKPTLLLAPYLFTKQLVKLLFYRKGILDGIAGIIWSGLSAYYEWVMARKYIALIKQG